MKKTLLRTVLRKEVVGLARITVIILAVFLFLLEFGFRSDGSTAQLLDQLSYGLVIAAAFVTLGSLLRTSFREQHVRKAELIWLFAALLLIFIKPAGMAVWHHAYHWPNLVFLLGFIFIELSRLELGRNSTLFNPALLFTTSFVLIIAVGTALFLLPKAGTRQITLIEALFTSTSAVCVTGLSVIDVSKDLTFAGQCVLLFLIQIGGLGVMTFTSFFAFFFKGRTSLEEQLRIRDIANTSLVNARSFITQVILFTIGVEIVGTGFIYYSVPSAAFVDTGDRLFFSVFHAISAFNNAGFSTLSAGMYDPILRYNYALMWIIGLMLIFGGLGFGIIFNFSKYVRLWIRERIKRFFTGTPCQRHPRLVNLGSRMALQVTVILIAVGTMAVMVFEWNGALVEHQTWWGRISTAFFTGVTPRTAGFNVVDYGLLSVPTLMVTLLLMYIGASPGSTGGGIKTTTFAVATLNIFATARGRRRIEYGGREISNLSTRRAFAAIVLSLIFLGLSITVIASLEKELPLMPIAFECFSAFSTVGLSMNLTPHLGDAARIALVVVMFVGRVSALTLLVGVLRQVQTTPYRYPKEDILIN
ncbi:MAG: TrkH family potassium uptake protein [Flavobacteriales bacterium]|jgi:Trk-type K+ transport system membrane component